MAKKIYLGEHSADLPEKLACNCAQSEPNAFSEIPGPAILHSGFHILHLERSSPSVRNRSASGRTTALSFAL